MPGLWFRGFHSSDVRFSDSRQILSNNQIMCFFRSPQNRKASVQIRVAGSQDLLVITCPSLSVAENLADLIDGYCRLVNNSSTSIWSRKGKQTRWLAYFKFAYWHQNFGKKITVTVWFPVWTVRLLLGSRGTRLDCFVFKQKVFYL